jgi:CubicO group peptidase (beta-lactamase class C family)
LLAHDGNWRGRQLIPASWIRDATTVRADQSHLRPGIAASFFGYGYGYQTWIFPGDRRMFALLGVRGQSIFVDPQSHLVMVNTAVRKQQAAGPGPRESTALWAAAVRELGGSR